MLENIKLLLGINSQEQDSLLQLLIDMCSQDAARVTNLEDLTSIENIIIQMVIYKYNRRGTEGLQSESYSGITYTYSEDGASYPDSIFNALKSFCRLKTL